MAYTRRQELMCTEAQMRAKPNVVLRENEVIYIKMNDGTIRQKIGDGSTTIINLPFTQVFDGSVVQTTGESETAVMSQKATTRELGQLSEDIADTKNDLNNLYTTISPTRRATFYSASGVGEDGSSNTRICTDLIRVNAGDRIKIGHNVLNHAVCVWKAAISVDNVVRQDYEFNNGSEIVDIEYSGYVVIVFAKPNTNEELTLIEYDTTIILADGVVSESMLSEVVDTKLSTYAEIISGKKVDKNTFVKIKAYISGANSIVASDYNASFYLPCEVNKDYVISKSKGNSAFRVTFTDVIPYDGLSIDNYTDFGSAKLANVKATAQYMVVTYCFNAEIAEINDIFDAISISYDTENSHEDRITNIENEPLKLRVASYNVGDFSGNGFDRGTADCKTAYRKVIANTNADVIGLQEDTNTFDGVVDQRDALYGMYKYYTRKGLYDYNYKSFLSNVYVNNVKVVNYEGTGFSHPYFLVGEITIRKRVILIVSVHYDWDDKSRRASQIGQVKSYANQYERAIIMGDNNPCDYIDGVKQSENSMHSTELEIWKTDGYEPANGGYFGEWSTDIDAETKYGKVYPCDNIIVSSNTIKIQNAYSVRADWMADHAIVVADLIIY